MESTPLRDSWLPRSSILVTALTVLAFTFGCGQASNSEGTSVEQTRSALNQTGWHGWRVIPNGGPLIAAPAVVSGPATVEVFGLAGDNAYWTIQGFTIDNGKTWSWTQWNQVTGALFSNKPSATRYNCAECIALAGLRDDDTIMVNIYQRDATNQLSWTGWAEIPASHNNYVAGPAITYSANFIYVFGVRSDYKLYWFRNDVTNGYNPNNWSGDAKLSDINVGTDPAAAALLAGRIFVAAQLSTDGKHHLMTSADGGMTWGPWQLITFQASGWAFSGGPALATSPGGQLNAFTTIQNGGRVMSLTSNDNGTTWGFPTLTDPDVVGGPAAGSSADGSIQLIGRSTDSNFWLNPYF
jgi:hypothetical protein